MYRPATAEDASGNFVTEEVSQSVAHQMPLSVDTRMRIPMAARLQGWKVTIPTAIVARKVPVEFTYCGVRLSASADDSSVSPLRRNRAHRVLVSVAGGPGDSVAHLSRRGGESR